jgi:hypothetical protein
VLHILDFMRSYVVKTESVSCLIGCRNGECERLFQLENKLVTVLRKQANKKHVIVEHVGIRGTEGNQLAIRRDIQSIVSVDCIIEHLFQGMNGGVCLQRDIEVLIFTFYVEVHQKGSTSL